MRKFIICTIICVLISSAIPTRFGLTQIDETVSQINDLSTDIENKKANIEHLQNKIEQYNEQIELKQKESQTLAVELDLLENRFAKTQLDIKATEEEIDLVNTQVLLLQTQVTQLQNQLVRDRELLSEVIRTIDANDSTMNMVVLFSNHSFSDIFNQMNYLQTINNSLQTTLTRAKNQQQLVNDALADQEVKKSRLDDLHDSLIVTRDRLVQEQEAKNVLLGQTKNSEQKFQALLYDLRQEAAYIDFQLSSLQKELGAKIDESDALGGGSVLSWPVDRSYKGLSATFHDPTYPFRHLFEHSGIDLPQPQGTPIKAAAPGYVAWTRTGNMYGNYVMIIHTDGMATLYAHMSKIYVEADQFVGRGEVIGATGGMPGTKGAGLSTGPHLHFEARKDGIPVNPLNYLISQ